MDRERFMQIAADALDELPREFRRRIRNVAILVEDYPPGQRRAPGTPPRPRSQAPRTLVLGVFSGVPTTRKSFFDVPGGPDHIVLYQKNIEAVCRGEDEIREQIRLTLIHELGHYFGMSEDQLRDV